MRNRSADCVFCEINGPGGYILGPQCEGGMRNRWWNPKSKVESEIVGGIRNREWNPKAEVESEIEGGIRDRRVESEIDGWEFELFPDSGTNCSPKFPYTER